MIKRQNNRRSTRLSVLFWPPTCDQKHNYDYVALTAPRVMLTQIRRPMSVNHVIGFYLLKSATGRGKSRLTSRLACFIDLPRITDTNNMPLLHLLLAFYVAKEFSEVLFVLWSFVCFNFSLTKFFSDGILDASKLGASHYIKRIWNNYKFSASIRSSEKDTETSRHLLAANFESCCLWTAWLC